MTGARSIRRRLRRRDAQAGFTLVELLMGIILSGIFAAALFAFFESGITSASTHESQAAAQAEGRRTMDLMARELRQAVSPDGGLTPPVQSLSPTAILFYVDNNRVPGNSAPRPQRIRYQISGNDLVREVSDPVGTAPPYTYTLRTTEVMVRNIANGATPLFAGFTTTGTAMAATVAAPVTAQLGTVTVRLLVRHRTGRTNSTLELTTNVSPRNPRTPR